MTETTLEQGIIDAIHAFAEDAATQRLRKITERMDRDHAEAKLLIEKRVRDEVGRIACLIVNDLSFERFGRDLRITVRFPENTKEAPHA